ncbi:MAG: nucleotide exchange factor GrpE, partial [Rhodospirillales bacterium]|nr:nucleotide exchange factor GrpE [Rhodospirillales bacterium]
QAEEASAKPVPPAEEVEAMRAELAEAKDQMLRAVAEAENVRRRSQAEIRTKLKFAHTEFARDLLAVADNLSRAVDSVKPEERKADAALENLCVGVEMTAREMENAFQKVKITSIDPLGEKFDHNYHQAMFEAEDPSVPAGTVVQVLGRGYMIHDRLLRPAMVGVSKGGPKTEEAGDAPSDGEVAAAKAVGDTAYEKATGDGDASGVKLDTEL